jgi:uncharacterized repeat protein (TIGR01451 family)
MSRVRRCMVGVPLVVLAMLVMSASADARTLGNTTQPAGTSDESCAAPSIAGADVIQVGTDASYDYTVPAGGGEITSWSFGTAGATAGTPYGLVVARPSGTSGAYTIVGSDLETVPSSLPPVATFTLAAPIAVQSGDVIGAVVQETTTVGCIWVGSPLTTSDVLGVALTAAPLGGTFTPTEEPGGVIDVSVNLVQSEDVGVTQQVVPGSLVAGETAAFLLSVTDSGPANAPVTFTDAVPNGLTIVSVNAGTGSCTTSGQIITCTLPSAPTIINVVVSAAAVGDYTNDAAVSTALTDPNSANNSSSATLDVTAAPLCHLFSLARFKLAQAKTVISDLGCSVGKVKTKTSTSIPKGEVISISPGAGKAVKLGTKITIVISSGKPKKKTKRSDR